MRFSADNAPADTAWGEASPHLRARRLRPAAALLAGILALGLPGPALRADGSIDYKFENYREEDGRITVQTQSGSVDQDLGPFTNLNLTGTLDAISGASPTGAPAAPGSDQVPLSQIHERRKAWSGDLSQEVGAVKIDAGFADSRENDYVSNGWSLNTQTDFNEKNTTLLAGVAGTDDRVEVFFAPVYLPKHSTSEIAGLTQLLDPDTFVTVNVTLARFTGYLGEPHKLVEKSVQIIPNVFLTESFPENRPMKRDKVTVFAALNHAFPKIGGAVEASYRYYSDTYGIVANTVELSFLQHLGAQVILSPSVRLNQQGAANFYSYDLDHTAINPTHFPTGVGPYYSSDFRLSDLDSTTYGLKATWKPKDWVQLDVAYDEYTLRGRDGVTPASAYPTAGITTVGIRFQW
jgi:hypothetical protein